MVKALYCRPNKEVKMAKKVLDFVFSHEVKQDDVVVDNPFGMEVRLKNRRVVSAYRGYLETRWYNKYEGFETYFDEIPGGARLKKCLEDSSYSGYYGGLQINPDPTDNSASETLVWRLAMKMKFFASGAGCKTSLERVVETLTYDVIQYNGPDDEDGEYQYTSVCEYITWVLMIEF